MNRVDINKIKDPIKQHQNRVKTHKSRDRKESAKKGHPNVQEMKYIKKIKGNKFQEL